MKGKTTSRLVTACFLAVMALLVGWFVSLGHARFYFCAGLLTAMTLALALVGPGRRGRYALGVAVGAATLVLALWPTDPSGGYCGSVLNPHRSQEGYDLSDNVNSYFKACDEKAAVYGMLVMMGSAATGLLIATSLQPLRRRRSDSSSAVSEPETVTPDR